MIFFRFFLVLYAAFRASSPSQGCDAVTNVERCPPNRRPIPWLWTMPIIQKVLKLMTSYQVMMLVSTALG